MSPLDAVTAGPYNVALVTAFVTGVALAIRAGGRNGLPTDSWRVLIGAAAIASLLGSKYIFLDFSTPELGKKSNLGGIVAGVLTVVIFARAFGIGVRRALDTLTIPTLAGMAIGRVGCFLAGCCKGVATTLPWGVHYDGDAHAVHPVQLYEMLGDVALVAWLTQRRSAGHEGATFRHGVIGYALVRIAVEFLRDGRSVVAGLNPVQWSLCGVLLAMVIWSRHDVGRDIARVRVRLSGPEWTMIGLSSAMLAVLILVPAQFTILERTVLLAVVTALGLSLLVRRVGTIRSWWPRATLPSVGAFLLLQPGDSTKQRESRTEILAGGALWGAPMSVVVGVEEYDAGDGCGITRRETRAKRSTLAGWGSFGFRRTSGDNRVTVQGMVLAGRDRLNSISEGPVPSPVAQEVSIKGGGFTAAVASPEAELEVSALTGDFSSLGARRSGVIPSATIRYGTRGGVYVEAHAVDTKWYSTTGDISYVGLGYTPGVYRSRVMLGVGNGMVASLTIPTSRVDVDVSARVANKISSVAHGGSSLRAALVYRFPLR